jgi:hypothetical protein
MRMGKKAEETILEALALLWSMGQHTYWENIHSVQDALSVFRLNAKCFLLVIN